MTRSKESRKLQYLFSERPAPGVLLASQQAGLDDHRKVPHESICKEPILDSGFGMHGFRAGAGFPDDPSRTYSATRNSLWGAAFHKAKHW
jgi:hypothetical protein